MGTKWLWICGIACLLLTPALAGSAEAAPRGPAAETPATEVGGPDVIGAEVDFFAARWDRVERAEPTGPAGPDPAATYTLGLVIAAAEQKDDKKAKKNEETVLALYEAFAVGDLDTILAIIHPDVVWVESEGIPYGGTFIGRDAVFAGVFAKIAEEWDDFTAEINLIFAAEADRVVVLGQDSGTFKATGKSMVAPAASIWTLNKDNQVVRFEQYIDTRAVYEATLP